MEALKLEKYCTFEEWLLIAVHDETGVMTELIDGRIFSMASPSLQHQDVLAELFSQFRNHLKGKQCKAYMGITVHLDKSKDTGFIPDMVVICDRNKLKDKGCEGAPDLIIEVLSPSNSQHDKVYKYNEYRKAGVKEYWIVDPRDSTVFVHVLIDDKYTTAAYGDKDIIPVHVLPGCNVELTPVFAEIHDMQNDMGLSR